MKCKYSCQSPEHQVARRQFLGEMAAGAGIASGGLSFLAQPAAAKQLAKDQKRVLVIFMSGGLSQLESWDPKPRTQFGGPFRAIPTSVTGVHVSELLPKSAKQMHRLAVMRGMHTQDNSHSAGVGRIQRGDPKNRGVIYPYFGSSIAKLLGPGKSQLPPYVWIKPGSGGFLHQDAGFLGPKYGALAFGDGKPPDNLLRPESVSAADEDDRDQLRKNLNRRYAERRRKQNNEANSYVFDVARTLMKRRDIFDTSKFAQQDIDRYGSHDLGRHMLIGRKMLEAGVTFVKVNSYGWDTHGDNFNGHHSLMPKFDQAFSSIIEDLAERSMLDNVLVIAMSEFGRTPRINKKAGRDHWGNLCTLAFAGGGLPMGQVIGQSDRRAAVPAGDPVSSANVLATIMPTLRDSGRLRLESGIPSDIMRSLNEAQPIPRLG